MRLVAPHENLSAVTSALWGLGLLGAGTAEGRRGVEEGVFEGVEGGGVRVTTNEEAVSVEV